MPGIPVAIETDKSDGAGLHSDVADPKAPPKHHVGDITECEQAEYGVYAHGQLLAVKGALGKAPPSLPECPTGDPLEVKQGFVTVKATGIEVAFIGAQTVHCEKSYKQGLESNAVAKGPANKKKVLGGGPVTAPVALAVLALPTPTGDNPPIPITGPEPVPPPPPPVPPPPPPPVPTETKCKLVVFTAKCRHGRYAPTDKPLRVVGNFVDNITLSAALDHPHTGHPLFTVQTSTSTYTRTGGTAEVSASNEPTKFWTDDVAPKVYKIAAAGCVGTKSVEIHAYPPEVTKEVDGSSQGWQAFEACMNVIASAVGLIAKVALIKELTFKILHGRIAITAGWKENEASESAWFHYLYVVQAKPLFEVEGEVKVGLDLISSAVNKVTSWLGKVGKAIQSFLERIGKWPGADIIKEIFEQGLSVKFGGTIEADLRSENTEDGRYEVAGAATDYITVGIQLKIDTPRIRELLQHFSFSIEFSASGNIGPQGKPFLDAEGTGFDLSLVTGGIKAQGLIKLYKYELWNLAETQIMDPRTLAGPTHLYLVKNSWL